MAWWQQEGSREATSWQTAEAEVQVREAIVMPHAKGRMECREHLGYKVSQRHGKAGRGARGTVHQEVTGEGQSRERPQWLAQLETKQSLTDQCAKP